MMSRQEARDILAELEDAEGVVQLCDRLMSSTTDDDVIDVKVGQTRIKVQAKDLRPLAERWRRLLRHTLASNGYQVPES